jgi:hemerythrin-like domain-containing protein
MQTTLTATQILKSEHEVILDVLDCLDKLADGASTRRVLDDRSARDILELLTTFADRCHHGKEEGALFPMLVRRGLPEQVGPLAVMLSEHAAGRAEIAGMRSALEESAKDPGQAAERFAAHARVYVDLLRDHIAKENGVLFPMADGMLSEADQAEVLERFRTVESADMGAGVHERCLALAGELMDRLGVKPGERGELPAGGCCGHGTCG